MQSGCVARLPTQTAPKSDRPRLLLHQNHLQITSDNVSYVRFVVEKALGKWGFGFLGAWLAACCVCVPCWWRFEPKRGLPSASAGLLVVWSGCTEAGSRNPFAAVSLKSFPCDDDGSGFRIVPLVMPRKHRCFRQTFPASAPSILPLTGRPPVWTNPTETLPRVPQKTSRRVKS
jgi:hypothetical protein